MKTSKKTAVKRKKGATKKKVLKSASTARTLKTFNVFYTQPACQHETSVKAYSLEEAVKKVKEVLNDSVESVEGGWECLTDEEYEKRHGYRR